MILCNYYSYEHGSNLHGFLNDYKKVVFKSDMPELMKAINWKRSDLGYKPSIYSEEIR